MKKAFTLIELLVVIAIIAILAAILFPVFAQAKEAAKKTQALSNVKQTGTAMNIYLADYDDTMPMAHSRRADNTHRHATIHPAPSGAIGAGWEDPIIVSQVNSVWHMAVQPYMKNWQLLNSPNQNSITLAGEVFTNTVPAQEIGVTYNGFLNTYNATAVNNASVVPLIWLGTGNLKIRGRAGSNPALNCGTTTGDCRFNPGGGAHATAAAGNQSLFFGYGGFSGSYRIWAFGGNQNGGGTIVGRVDSSAKYQRVGIVAPPSVNVNATVDPYAQYTNNGSGFTYYATNDANCAQITGANTGTGFTYACHFRPDREN